jgi:ubiquinone/menaquinone biosynthesis C-methylase UbiE
MPRFSEQETERYYDTEDATYRSFWDKEGSLHWGYFDATAGEDFLKASARLNDIMLAKSGIGAGSAVLDLGCGNGNTSLWLAEQHPCEVAGIDLSGVRIANAIEQAAKASASVRSRVEFAKASATALPYPDDRFTHVWSQATIYHVPDKEAVLREARRVLRAGGTFILDDLTRPKRDISAESQRFVYDRLLFDTPYSFTGYQDGLCEHGFEVVEAEDLSPHLAKSYTKLGEMARAAASKSGSEELGQLAAAYRYMVAAVEKGELGWAMYVCRKP